MGNVVAAGIAALQAEQAATAGGAAGASKATAAAACPAAAASPAGGGVPAGSPMQPAAAAGAAAEVVSSGTRLLDTMTFLTDLGRWAGALVPHCNCPSVCSDCTECGCTALSLTVQLHACRHCLRILPDTAGLAASARRWRPLRPAGSTGAGCRTSRQASSTTGKRGRRGSSSLWQLCAATACCLQPSCCSHALHSTDKFPAASPAMSVPAAVYLRWSWP